MRRGRPHETPTRCLLTSKPRSQVSAMPPPWRSASACRGGSMGAAGGYCRAATSTSRACRLSEQLQLSTGLQAFADNDANMALVAEAQLGAARGFGDAVMLTIGTGIGGAVLAGGRIFHGGGTAGQLGHITVDAGAGGKPCNCGRSGCLETESSGTALAGHIAAAGFPAGTRIEELLRSETAGVPRRCRRLGSAIACRYRQPGRGVRAACRRSWRRARWCCGQRALPISGGIALVPVPGDCGAARRRGGRHRRGAGGVGALPMKRVVLVNGVPASGKSTVARAISRAGNWPLLTLDTIKEALFAHLGTGDRDYNRLLGRASYQAMFDLTADFPDGATVVMDAWFGFQPADVLDGLHRQGRHQHRRCRSGARRRRKSSASAIATRVGEPQRRPSRARLRAGVDRAGDPRAATRRLSDAAGRYDRGRSRRSVICSR